MKSRIFTVLLAAIGTGALAGASASAADFGLNLGVNYNSGGHLYNPGYYGGGVTSNCSQCGAFQNIQQVCNGGLYGNNSYYNPAMNQAYNPQLMGPQMPPMQPLPPLPSLTQGPGFRAPPVNPQVALANINSTAAAAWMPAIPQNNICGVPCQSGLMQQPIMPVPGCAQIQGGGIGQLMAGLSVDSGWAGGERNEWEKSDASSFFAVGLTMAHTYVVATDRCQPTVIPYKAPDYTLGNRLYGNVPRNTTH